MDQTLLDEIRATLIRLQDCSDIQMADGDYARTEAERLIILMDAAVPAVEKWIIDPQDRSGGYVLNPAWRGSLHSHCIPSDWPIGARFEAGG
ncbi:hypothetical protein [Rhodoferax sp.]|uniref:hypothetical protein n=1 Tax=Rhodoferax sp. TaxID=50421 RepID=UPI00374DA2F4